ncbi:MAG: secretion type II protein, partial [Pseudomonas sp.]
MNKSRLLMSLCFCAGLAACSSAQIAKDEASALMESGQYEAGLARIEQGLSENPRDTDLHIALNSGRARAVTA